MKVLCGWMIWGNVEGVEAAVRESCDEMRSPRWGSTRGDEAHVTLGGGERSGVMREFIRLTVYGPDC